MAYTRPSGQQLDRDAVRSSWAKVGPGIDLKCRLQGADLPN